jgi:hypothetical protein
MARKIVPHLRQVVGLTRHIFRRRGECGLNFDRENQSPFYGDDLTLYGQCGTSRHGEFNLILEKRDSIQAALED